MDQVTEVESFMGKSGEKWDRHLRRRVTSIALATFIVLPLFIACGDSNSSDPFCGDGIVQRDNAEECDDGNANGANGRCNNDCLFNEDACTFDRSKVCTEATCGDVIGYDSCGQMALANCGGCADAALQCVDNACVPKAEDEA